MKSTKKDKEREDKAELKEEEMQEEINKKGHRNRKGRMPIQAIRYIEENYIIGRQVKT